MILAIPLMALAMASGSTLDQKIAEVIPTAKEEKWLQIPWRTNLMAARKEAAAQGKPMFLWIMNGNPLGCT
jgi:hypothetical protein